MAGLLVAAAIVFLWLRDDGQRSTESLTSEPASDNRPSESAPATRAAYQPVDEAPPVESRPGEATVAGLRLAFVDDEGTRVTGFTAVFRDGGAPIHGVLDASGFATFDAIELPASAVILPYSRDPAVARLPRGSGEVTIPLPRGAVVSGKAFVNGAVPTSELELRLVATPPERFRDSWPPEVDRWMRLLKPEGLHLRAWTDLRDGNFRFAGLHTEWKGTLEIPNGYRMESGDARNIALGQPTTGIVLNLVELPHLRGRVVGAKDHVPIPGAAISLRVVATEGRQGGAGGLFSDVAGRFAIPVPGDAVWKSGSLDIFNLRNSGVRRVAISGADLAQGRDLGDVEVEAPRAARLRIKSKKGVPIEAARVVAKTPPDHLGPIARSGKDGKAEFAVPPAATGFRVVASGYEPVEIPIPADDTETEVTLSRDTRLTVRVVLADGVTDADAVELWLESDHQILQASAKAERDYVEREAPVYDVTNWETADDGARVQLGYAPATISCIQPGRGFQVRARELVTATTTSQSVVLAEEEWKTVVVTLPIPARKLEGKVVDPAGEPLYEAQVSLESGPLTVGVRRTGRDGTFLFDRLTADRVMASAELAGFARWRQEVALSPEGVRLSIQLARAEPLTVSVVDGRGNPVAGASLSIPAVSKMVIPTNARGQAVIASPPDGEFAVTARFGSVTTTETHRASAQGVVVRLPTHGAVDVTVPAALGPPGSSIQLEAVVAGSRVVPQAMVENTGHAIARGVPVGTYRVTMTARGQSAVTITGPTIEVKDGETTSVVLESPR